MRPMNTTIEIKAARLLLVLPLLLAGLAGCGGKTDDDAIAAANRATGSQAAATHTHDDAPHQRGYGDQPAADAPAAAAGAVTLAGVTFTPPEAWTSLGPDGMRQAQFRHPPVDGDQAEGEVNVFYFGPQSGGGVEANLNRWIGQMVLPDGADPQAAAQRSTFTADGMPGHVVSLNGSYKSGGGRPMGGGGETLPGYRLVGVVLEGPQGSLFFKLTGPEATAKAMEGDLLAMVKSARK